MRAAASHRHDPLSRVPRLPPFPQPPIHDCMLYYLWRYYLRDYRYHVSLRQLVGPMADCLQGRHTYTALCLLCGTIARQSDIFLTVEEAGQVRPGSPGPRGWGKERGVYKPAEFGSALERVHTRENGNDDASHIVGGDAKILKCHKNNSSREKATTAL